MRLTPPTPPQSPPHLPIAGRWSSWKHPVPWVWIFLTLKLGGWPIWETTGMSGDLARDGKESKGQLGLGRKDNGKLLQIIEQRSDPLRFNSFEWAAPPTKVIFQALSLNCIFQSK